MSQQFPLALAAERRRAQDALIQQLRQPHPSERDAAFAEFLRRVLQPVEVQP